MVDQQSKTHNSSKSPSHEAYLILHDIRSVENVGSLFRTADALGVSKIYLSGYTPSPIDRFGRMRKDFVKASLGAEKTVPYESVNSLRAVIKKLQKDGVFVVAIEQDERSVHYKKLGVRFPIACILGNEVLGIEKTILKRVDATVEIPMCGKKESLNVAVAGGIVLSELLGI